MSFSKDFTKGENSKNKLLMLMNLKTLTLEPQSEETELQSQGKVDIKKKKRMISMMKIPIVEKKDKFWRVFHDQYRTN